MPVHDATTSENLEAFEHVWTLRLNHAEVLDALVWHRHRGPLAKFVGRGLVNIECSIVMILGAVLIASLAFWGVAQGANGHEIANPGIFASAVGLSLLLTLGGGVMATLNQKRQLTRLIIIELNRPLAPEQGIYRISIRDRGVEHVHGNVCTQAPWSSIVEIDESKLLFVFILFGLSPLFLPKRALKSDQDPADAMERWREKMITAGGGRDAHVARWLEHREVLCPKCNYSLRGVRNAVCPECGLSLDIPTLPQAFYEQ